MNDFKYLKEEVIDPGLCTRCGSCVGVCPEKIVFINDPLGDCLPKIENSAADKCMDCDAPCVAACTGKHVDFPAMYDSVFGAQPPDYLLGHTISHHIGYAADSEIRRRGSSGGVISGILDYLLRENKIDGVLTLIDSPDAPLQPRAVVIRSADDLPMTAQSKYCLAPVNTALDKIAGLDGKYAYVGLPCQVQSIRKLQSIDHPSVKNISLVIGSYCGSINYFSSIIDYLKKFDVHDLSLIEKIKYREGEWPGYMLVKLSNGREFRLEKFYANYMTMFYTVKRCQVCFDLTNEFADISAADAWAPKYEERGKGFSLFISRTKAGEEMIEECLEKGELVSDETLERREVLTMHSHTIDNKKIGAVVRMQMWRRLGRDIPEYNLEIDDIPLKRNIMGAVVGTAFEIGSTTLARQAVGLFPLDVTGRAFKLFRTTWKAISKPKKTKPEYNFKPVVKS